MITPVQSIQPVPATDQENFIGKPMKFDAERVVRKKPRWLAVLAVMFLVIVCTAGIVVWQGKQFFQKQTAQRDEAAKKSQGDMSPPRTKLKFSEAPIDDLPDSFGKAATSPAAVNPIAVVDSAGAARPGQRRATDGVTPVAGIGAPAPIHSMLVDSDSAAAPSVATLSGPSGLVAPGVTVAATPPTSKPKSVQEMARRNASATISTTAQALAVNLGDRNLLLARGAAIPCTLQTQVNSNIAGAVSCIVSQDIYSDNGRILLVERGSICTGEYRSAVKNGDSRLAIVWNRIKTPNGVVIDVDSPTTDGVGTAGVDGSVDNHWFDRIGAAFLLSLVGDTIAIQVAKEGAQAGGSSSGQGYQSTTGTTKSLAERVLESTINIAPTITKNRGERLMVMVNKDLWFDQVYSVKTR